MFLLLAGNAIPQDIPELKDYTDELISHLRKGFENPGQLEKYLTETLSYEHFLWPDSIPLFKQKFGITDDTLRTALMGIYQSVQHLKDAPFQKEDSDEITKDKRRLLYSIEWFGYCADEPVKRLLLDIANDDTIAKGYRYPAISASIQCADVQQVRDVILRFTVDVKIPPHSTWLAAQSVYDRTRDDPQKRESILATLIVLLAREEDKTEFAEMDKQLAKRSEKYATSSQRLAMVQRMSKLPPALYDKTDPDLKNALKSFRFRLFKTNVSTNMTELMARDFSKSN